MNGLHFNSYYPMLSKSDYTLIADETIAALSYPGDALKGLYEPVAYALSAGGKRLRPVLCLMAADAFCGDPSKAASAAAGLEMFHNFTLLHDDVMDNSDLRRGRPTVHKRWDTNTAILSGDTMLTLATQLISRVDDGVLRSVLDTFNDMAIKVYEGQRLDMDFENRDDVTVSDYVEMVKAKTGALLGAAAKIGALAAGANERDAEAMYTFGLNLGVAFQIQDDFLDVFGDATTFGKPIGGDINNQKKTFLLLSALGQETAESAALREAMRLPAGDTRVKAVTKIYQKMGIDVLCAKETAAYTSAALKALKKTALGDNERESFRALAEKLTGRRK